MKGINQKLKLYCPVWYNRIRRTRDENIDSFRDFDTVGKNGTSIRSGSYCVVGELHDWCYDYKTKEGYYCGTCGEFSRMLMYTAKVQYSLGFCDNINQLVDHIERYHPEIVERCSGKAQ